MLLAAWRKAMTKTFLPFEILLLIRQAPLNLLLRTIRGQPAKRLEDCLISVLKLQRI